MRPRQFILPTLLTFTLAGCASTPQTLTPRLPSLNNEQTAVSQILTQASMAKTQIAQTPEPNPSGEAYSNAISTKVAEHQNFLADYEAQIAEIEEKQMSVLGSYGFAEAAAVKSEYVKIIRIFTQPDSPYNMEEIAYDLKKMDEFLKIYFDKKNTSVQPSDIEIVLALSNPGYCLPESATDIINTMKYLHKKNINIDPECGSPGATISLANPNDNFVTHNNRYIILIATDVNRNCVNCGPDEVIMTYRQKKEFRINRYQLLVSTTFHEYLSVLMRIYDFKMDSDGYTNEDFVSDLELQFMKWRYSLTEEKNNRKETAINLPPRNNYIGRPSFPNHKPVKHFASNPLAQVNFRNKL
jgi:hypothetical protein